MAAVASGRLAAVHDPAGPTEELRRPPDPTLAVPIGGPAPALSPRRGVPTRWLVAALAAVVLGGGGWLALRGPGPQPGAWGGHENGRIPAAELCPLAGAPSHRLRCDAAEAYGRMANAYRARFGTRLCITDSYRPYEAQVVAERAKPGLAAKPGTSNHGWALAVDLCGGANSFGTRQHRWLQANAATFGWRQPSWAAPKGDRPEPWHWEFGKL